MKHRGAYSTVNTSINAAINVTFLRALMFAHMRFLTDCPLVQNWRALLARTRPRNGTNMLVVTVRIRSNRGWHRAAT